MAWQSMETVISLLRVKQRQENISHDKFNLKLVASHLEVLQSDILIRVMSLFCHFLETRKQHSKKENVFLRFLLAKIFLARVQQVKAERGFKNDAEHFHEKKTFLI